MVFTKEDLMDGRVWVGGGRGRKNGSCRRREMAVPRFPKTCMSTG